MKNSLPLCKQKQKVMEKLFKIKNYNSFIIVNETEINETGKVKARHLFSKTAGLLPVNELEVPTKKQVKDFYDWTETIFGYSTLSDEKRYQKDLHLVATFLIK